MIAEKNQRECKMEGIKCIYLSVFLNIQYFLYSGQTYPSQKKKISFSYHYSLNNILQYTQIKNNFINSMTYYYYYYYWA